MTTNTKLFVSSAAASIAGFLLGYYIQNKNQGTKIEDSDSDSDEEYDVADSEGEPCKLVLVVRKDLQMTKGKIAAQCGHAAVGCYERAIESTPQNVIAWKQQGQPKIALQCESLQELQNLKTRAARLGVISEQIRDAGRTQVEPGSVTVLGVGPAPISKVNEITGHLKLL